MLIGTQRQTWSCKPFFLLTQFCTSSWCGLKLCPENPCSFQNFPPHQSEDSPQLQGKQAPVLLSFCLSLQWQSHQTTDILWSCGTDDCKQKSIQKIGTASNPGPKETCHPTGAQGHCGGYGSFVPLGWCPLYSTCAPGIMTTQLPAEWVCTC